MSRKHRSRGQSSTASRSKEYQGFRRSSQTPVDTISEPRSAKPSPIASDVPSVDQLWTPIALPQPLIRHGGLSMLSTSYFIPMSKNATPKAIFPPLSTDMMPTSHTLLPLSVALPDVLASISQKHPPGSPPMKPDTLTPDPIPLPGSDLAQIMRATPTTSFAPDEKFRKPLSSSRRSRIDRPSTNSVHALQSHDENTFVGSPGLSTRLAMSPTPGSGSKKSNRDRPHADNREVESVGIHPALQVSETPESSATGRLSDKAAEELAEGFTEFDHLVKKIKSSTGLSTKQIIRRWLPPNSRDLNFWNIYQKYFHAKTEEELKRLHLKDRPARGIKADVKTIRAAYKAFQKDEPNHESILEVFWRIHEIDGSNTTVNGRSRDFLKWINALKRLAESASTIDGFEIAFCAVGSVVHQDQSLSATFCSPMVSDFFSERLHLSDNEIEGHLKAHAYDNASRTALIHETRDNISPIVGQPSSTAVSAGVGDELVKVKGESRRLLAILKDKFMKLLGPCKIPQLRQSHLSFSDIPKILAENGWVMENWPENVPFPCDLKKGKGIASLRAVYRKPLLKAFDDRHYPLKVIKKYSEAVPPSEPVIIGLPPPPESRHTHGRRKFLDASQTADRRGPARRVSSNSLTHQESTPSQKRSGKTREGEEVDCMHPRKRRRGNR